MDKHSIKFEKWLNVCTRLKKELKYVLDKDKILIQILLYYKILIN